jgi:hypothetical protein
MTDIADLFAGAPGDLEDLTRQVTAAGVLGPFARLGAVLPTLAVSAAAAVPDALRIDLGNVVVWGWQTHQALHAAAEATLAGTGPPQQVTLASHSITSEHHPAIDVIVDGPPNLATTVPLTVRLVIAIDTVRIAVQRGRIVDLRTAGCKLTATLDIGGISSTRSCDLALPRLVNLDPGAPLLPRAAYQTSAPDQPGIRWLVDH